MSRHRHAQFGTGRSAVKDAIQPRAALDLHDLTPGREPAEGPDLEIRNPTHERWEQDTADRDPAEG